MPNFFIESEVDLDEIKKEIEELFVENIVMLHVCKITHGTPQCEQCSTTAQEQAHPNFYIIFISAYLENVVKDMFLEFMENHPLDDEEDEDDIDGNSHINTIMMCPLCGAAFSSQL